MIQAYVVAMTPGEHIGVFTRDAFKAGRRSLKLLSTHRFYSKALEAAARFKSQQPKS